MTLKHPATGLSRRVQTDAAGNYEFLSVPVGENYTLQVEAPGFRTSVQTGIKLLVNQRYRADFKLVSAPLAQTVEVSSSSTQVDTTSTQLGDVIEDKKMTSLPLNGRSYIDSAWTAGRRDPGFIRRCAASTESSPATERRPGFGQWAARVRELLYGQWRRRRGKRAEWRLHRPHARLDRRNSDC